mmetsp:Transcript_25783/g.59350  ORF Transcript_25783/g.59350 Transcript_25783/m.59350 type:complete len:345 (-) Transcript_25783:329-1363(-)
MMKGGGKDEGGLDDDIMADIAYRERKGGGKARMEILQSLGDGLTADEDGVMGGANDGEFGGNRRFGAVKAANTGNGASNKKKGKNAGAADSANVSASNGGMCMADDFFSRDVGAEYEEMDYDPAELFDDDDVDVQGDVEGPDNNGKDMEDDIDDDMEDDTGGGAGLASSSVLRDMMRKANGDESEAVAPKDAAEAGTIDTAGKRKTAYGYVPDEPVAPDPAGVGDISAIPGADPADQASAADKAEPLGFIPDDVGPMFDADGMRVITKKAIQREIWLTGGQAIELGRFMQIFGISGDTGTVKKSKKKRAERKKTLAKMVRELCNKENDPQQGIILVLKPHYAKM